MIKRFFFLSSVLIMFVACEDDPLDVDVSDVKRESHFKRFDRAFFESDTSSFLFTEFDSLRATFPVFFESGGTPRFWKNQRLDERQNELYAEVRKVFSSMSAYDSKLNTAMKHFYYYFPDSPSIDFYTYISNLDFNYPVLYNPQRQLCFVATDLYLGAEKKFYHYLPAYLAYERQPQFMIRDIMAEIGKVKVPSPADNPNLLDRMIEQGKLLYFLEAMMPSESKETLIKYKTEQLQFCQNNERNIWAYFVENNLLFSTREDAMRYFINPAPFSKFGMKFDKETPGRIGHWLGWQIVKAYMDNNPGTSLKQMLEEKDSRKFLKISAYKP